MGQTFCMDSEAMHLDYLNFPNELEAVPPILRRIFFYPCLLGASLSPFFIAYVLKMTMVEHKNAMCMRIYYEESYFYLHSNSASYCLGDLD